MEESTKVNEGKSKILDKQEDDLLETLFETHRELVAAQKDRLTERKKILRQKGFYAVIKPSHDRLISLQDLVAKHRQEAEVMSKKWDVLYASFQADIDKRITKADDDIKELGIKKNEAEKELDELKSKQTTLIAEIENLKVQLLQCRNELLLAKGNIEEKFIGKVDSEISKLAGLQKRIYEDVKNFNDNRFATQKEGTDLFINQLRKDRSIYEDRFDLINKKIKLIGANGINAYVAYLLFYIGLGTTGVAGYFFAIFSAKANLSSQDAFYYLLKNVITAASRNDGPPLLFKFAYLFGIVMVISLISWVAHLILTKGLRNIEKKETTDTQTVVLHYHYKGEALDASGNIQTKSWFSFWLRVVPFVIIIGIFILLLSLNQNIESDTNELSASTEGLVIGTAIAMGLSAVVYIYIIKVVEPRVEQAENLDLNTPMKQPDGQEHEEGNGSPKETVSQNLPRKRRNQHRILLNWELVACLLLFVLSVLVFGLFRQGLLPKSFLVKPEISISVIGFIMSCILASFAFAYGIRYYGLIVSAKAAGDNLLHIDAYIASHTVPEPPDIVISLKNNLEQLAQVHAGSIAKRGAILSKKNMELGNITDTSGRVLGFFPYNSRGATNIDENRIFQLSEWEAEFFPEYAEQLKIFHAHYAEKKAKLNEVNTQISEFKKERKIKIEEIKKDISILDEKKEKWQLIRAKAKRADLLQESSRKQQLEEDISFLEDGFNLGLWYQKVPSQS